ncbi:MAG: response regulator transcription factor [Blautia sp.]|nr:response regulator transcription factor [Blautia sp.]
MLKIAVCEDDERQRNELHTALEQYISSHGIAARVWSFTGPKALLSAVEENGVFDLYLLDVLMPEMDGIRLGLALRKTDANGLIVYLSTSRDFAVESYEARAFHYLVKPITADTLYPVLERCFLTLQNTHTKVIRVKTREGMVHLSLDEIYYVELTKRIIRYVCKTRTVDSLYVRVPFSEASAPLLKEANFFLCGSSFVVNLFHVTSADKNGVMLTSGQRLELPKAACAALRIAWSDYWMGGA